MSIEQLKAELDVETRWLHFPLHPKTPPEGIPMKELYRDRDPESTKAAGDHLKNAMTEAGLPYKRRTRLDNSRIAQELGAWADTQAGGAAFHDAIFKAYFVDDRSISDKDTLVEIAESVGLDGQEARTVLDERSLEVLEIKPKQGFYDFESKYTLGRAEYLIPAPLPADVREEVLHYAQLAHVTLGCSGVTRADFRYDESRRNEGIKLLEINTKKFIVLSWQF